MHKENFNNLFAAFVSALLANGGRLPKQYITAKTPIDYLAEARQKGLAIISEMGGDFELVFNEEPITSMEELLEKIPDTAHPSSGVYIGTRGVYVD